jgi:hypothetical protein
LFAVVTLVVLMLGKLPRIALIRDSLADYRLGLQRQAQDARRGRLGEIRDTVASDFMPHMMLDGTAWKQALSVRRSRRLECQ